MSEEKNVIIHKILSVLDYTKKQVITQSKSLQEGTGEVNINNNNDNPWFKSGLNYYFHALCYCKNRCTIAIVEKYNGNIHNGMQ